MVQRISGRMALLLKQSANSKTEKVESKKDANGGFYYGLEYHEDTYTFIKQVVRKNSAVASFF